MTPRTVTTRIVESSSSGHLVETLYDDPTTDEVLVCAPHGGGIEPSTGAQAMDLATRLPAASCWACFGYDEESAFDRWHVTSTEITPARFPLLDRIADRGFDTVIGLHGLGDERVLVGGGIDPETKAAVRDRLASAVPVPVETVSEGPYAGTDPVNVVNWLAAGGGRNRDRDGPASGGDTGGLQIEQGPATRDEAATTVVTVLAGLVEEGVL